MDYLPAVKVQLKVTRHSSAQYLKSISKNPQPFSTLWEHSVYGAPVSNHISPGPEISGSPSRGQSLCWQRAGTSVLRGQAPGNSWDHKRCLKTAILLAPWVVLNRVPTPSNSWRVQSLCQVTTPYQWDPFHFQNLPFGIMNLQTSTFSRSFPSGPVWFPPPPFREQTKASVAAVGLQRS